MQFPADLHEYPGRDERGDEDCEPDANHGQNAIAVPPGEESGVSLENESDCPRKGQDRPDARLTCGNKISQSVLARHREVRRHRRRQEREGSS
jgi:hypothetical protein